MVRSIIVLIVLAGLLQSCGASPDIYRVSWIRWSGDSIRLQVVDKQDPAKPIAGLETEFECLNCNLYLEPWTRELDANGETAFLLPESRQLITTRIAVRADGIDTPAVLFQRSPEEATQYYRLSTPLTGRIMTTGTSMLYHDDNLDSVAIALEMQDEANIFSELDDFYLVHHPFFPNPLYLLKLGVVRVR